LAFASAIFLVLLFDVGCGYDCFMKTIVAAFLFLVSIQVVAL